MQNTGSMSADEATDSIEYFSLDKRAAMSDALAIALESHIQDWLPDARVLSSSGPEGAELVVRIGDLCFAITQAWIPDESQPAEEPLY